VTPSLGNSCGALNKKAQIMLHVSCWQFYCQSAETAPDFSQPNDWRKRWDLVSRQNVSSEKAALVCGGTLFHAVLQPQETRGHRELIDWLTAPAPYWSVLRCVSFSKLESTWDVAVVNEDCGSVFCCRCLLSSVILLIVSDVSGSCLENLVSYMYSGTLRLTPDTVNVMLVVATHLEISTVIELCQKFIANPHYSNQSRESEYTDCNSEVVAQDVEVDEVVPACKATVKVEKENGTDDCVSTLQMCPSAALPRTTRSSSRKFQAVESGESRQVKPVTLSPKKTVRNSSRGRKRNDSVIAETDENYLPAKRSVSATSAGSDEVDHPVRKPAVDSDSHSQIHHYNTRRHSRSAVRKLVSSADVAIQNAHRKRMFSPSDRTLLLKVSRKHPASAAKNHQGTAVCSLPAWQQSRRIVLAARVFLAKRIKVTDHGLWHCRQCQIEALSSRSHLAAHILCRHRQRLFCGSCTRHFASFLALIRHKHSKHRYFRYTRSPISVCKKASGESWSSPSTTASLRNKCGWCGLKFEARSKLVEHRETVHRKRADAAPSTPVCRLVVRDWSCSEKDCGAKFKHKDKLRLHMAEHHPTVIFSCPECRFKTQMEHILKRYCSHFVLLSFIWL